MEKAKKLIAEYQRKIEACDTKISRAAKQLEGIHDKNILSLYLEKFSTERQLVQSQRQLYIQFIKDLEDLI